jgi:hypothetical protein
MALPVALVAHSPTLVPTRFAAPPTLVPTRFTARVNAFMRVYVAHPAAGRNQVRKPGRKRRPRGA